MLEDAAPLLLDAAELANLTGLICFLAEHKLKLRWHYVNTWTVDYKKQTLFTVKIFSDEKSWIFYPHCFNKPGKIPFNEWFTKYNDHIDDESLKELVWDNLQTKACKEKCKGIQNIEIMGRIFPRVCFCWSIRIRNPAGDVLERCKRLILVIRSIAEANAGV